MTILEKLRLLQQLSGLNQDELARKLGVTFAAFNRWWNGDAEPRTNKKIAIDQLLREYTGEYEVPENSLIAKKKSIQHYSRKYRALLSTILARRDIRDQFVLALTYHSNSIEGSTLTEPETAAVLFDNVALPNRTLTEQLEAKNHQAALEFVFEYVHKKNPLNEIFVLKLHAILMNGILSDAGLYRRHGVRIVGSEVITANYLKIPELMDEIVRELKKKSQDIISWITKIHARFEQIHPFADGNGRVGRLLMTAMLLKNNYAPAIIRQEKKRFYYSYLAKAQIKNEYNHLEDFVCDGVLEGFKILNV